MKFRWETEFKETEIGKIPKDWEVKRIEDIGEVSGGTTPSTKRKEYWDGDIPWITPEDLAEYEYRYISKGKRNITKKAVEDISIKLYPPGTVLLTSRAPIGYVAIAKNYLATNQGFRNIIPKNSKIVSEYLYYLLKILKRPLESMAGGSTFPELSGSTLKKVLIPYPPPPEQSRIATVLSWFDDLIENKKKQNEILEKMAMAIFKSWFVDFEPFQDEEFVYNEELGREIPKGWEVRRFGDISEFYDHKRIPLSEIERQKKRGSYPYYGANGVIDYIDDYIFDGKYLLVAEDGTVTDARGFAVAEIVEGKFWANNHVHVIQGKNSVPTEFLYLVLKHTPIEPYVTGAVQPKLNQKNFAKILVLLPPQPILQSFHSLVEPLFQKIILNQKQIMTLRKVRDTLLPLLVFGKLRVEEI
uniref:Restriction endonuclease subunit S n=1 Tax=candidate division WOR-3 bacterium TaxID=2052148 RepID=A0A7V4E3L9_UNCW3